MNILPGPLVFLFASGLAFFCGISFMVAGVLLKDLEAGGAVRSLLRIATLLGVGLVALSSTPFPFWIHCVLVALWIASLLMGRRTNARNWIPTLLFCLLAIILCALELRHHLAPNISLGSSRHVFVVGDSLSAGVHSGEKPWPSVLQETSGLTVTNLAEPGATLSTAREQIDGITDGQGLVVLEIGGNDMLAGRKPSVFYSDLEILLREVRAKNAQNVAMFELPLYPFRNGLGRAQRTLAKKYGIVLIPKRFMTNPLTMKGGTSDGLHLTQLGHDALAHAVAGLLRVE